MVFYYCDGIVNYYQCSVTMEEDQLFELEYHDDMEVLAELENGKILLCNLAGKLRMCGSA